MKDRENDQLVMVSIILNEAYEYMTPALHRYSSELPIF